MLGLKRLSEHIGFRRILGRAIVFILCFLRGSYIVEQQRIGTDIAIERKLSSRHDRVEMNSYNIDKQQVRYADIGHEQYPLLILFHGAPGGISTRYNVLENTRLLETYRIIILDRPGYGKSGAKAITSLEDQAKFSAPLLDLNKHTSKPILIGHSLAPPILAKMAVMYPEKIGGLIMVAGAMAGEHEIIRLASWPFYTKLSKRLIPPSLRSTIYEKLTHKAELKILETQRKDITHPMTILHGDNDWIVPVENAHAVEQRAINATLDMRVKSERDHFLPFDRAWTIEQAVYDMSRSLTTSSSTTD